MTVFIAPRTAPSETGPCCFGIRYFTPEMEFPLCGHGTLAAAAAVFRTDDTDAVRFEAPYGKAVVVARRVEDGRRVEIDLDAGRVEALSGAEDEQLRGVLARAFGKHVRVQYVGRGSAYLEDYVLVELDTHDLKGIKVDTDALVRFPPARVCLSFVERGVRLAG